ncbi:MAG: hypothetical protein QT01_C0004G0012 [archaeon GW2011_AR6]|nr:MAG: hypothetical protein QT01_C0004G0012 [archaeon GW2011_AR6]
MAKYKYLTGRELLLPCSLALSDSAMIEEFNLLQSLDSFLSCGITTKTHSSLLGQNTPLSSALYYNNSVDYSRFINFVIIGNLVKGRHVRQNKRP